MSRTVIFWTVVLFVDAVAVYVFIKIIQPVKVGCEVISLARQRRAIRAYDRTGELQHYNTFIDETELPLAA